MSDKFPMMAAARKFAADHAGWTTEKLQQAFEKEPGVIGFRISEGLLFAWSGIGKYIIPVEDVAWVRVNQTNHTMLGFTYAKWISFRLQVRPGITQEVMMNSETKAKEALNYLFRKLPETAFGNDQALMQMWNTAVRAGDRDFDALRQVGRMQHARR